MYEIDLNASLKQKVETGLSSRCFILNYLFDSTAKLVLANVCRF